MPTTSQPGSSAQHKPSLFGANGGNDNHPPLRMLAKLGSVPASTRPAATLFSRVMLIALIALTVIVAGYLIFGSKSPSSSMAVTHAEPLSPAVSAPLSAPINQADTDTLPQTATIISERSEPGDMALQQPAAPAVAPVAAAPAAPRKAVPVQSSNRPATTPRKSVTTTAAGTAAHTAEAAPNADGDIVLLEALVSHVSGRSSKSIPVETSKKVNGSPMLASSAATPAAGAANREVVLRSPTASTKELVAQCKTLGFLESELCQMRICSGRWGKDPSCPVTHKPAE